jgi:hypothetical protein
MVQASASLSVQSGLRAVVFAIRLTYSTFHRMTRFIAVLGDRDPYDQKKETTGPGPILSAIEELAREEPERFKSIAEVLLIAIPSERVGIDDPKIRFELVSEEISRFFGTQDCPPPHANMVVFQADNGAMVNAAVYRELLPYMLLMAKGLDRSVQLDNLIYVSPGTPACRSVLEDLVDWNEIPNATFLQRSHGPNHSALLFYNLDERLQTRAVHAVIEFLRGGAYGAALSAAKPLLTLDSPRGALAKAVVDFCKFLDLLLDGQVAEALNSLPAKPPSEILQFASIQKIQSLRGALAKTESANRNANGNYKVALRSYREALINYACISHRMGQKNTISALTRSRAALERIAAALLYLLVHEDRSYQNLFVDVRDWDVPWLSSCLVSPSERGERFIPRKPTMTPIMVRLCAAAREISPTINVPAMLDFDARVVSLSSNWGQACQNWLTRTDLSRYPDRPVNDDVYGALSQSIEMHPVTSDLELEPTKVILAVRRFFGLCLGCEPNDIPSTDSTLFGWASIQSIVDLLERDFAASA